MPLHFLSLMWNESLEWAFRIHMQYANVYVFQNTYIMCKYVWYVQKSEWTRKCMAWIISVIILYISYWCVCVWHFEKLSTYLLC